VSELGPESRELFKKARRDFEPSARDTARMDHALARRLGFAIGALLSAPGTASASLGSAPGANAASAGGSALVGVTKWIGGVLLVGAAALTTYLAAHSPTRLGPREASGQGVPEAVDTSSTPPVTPIASPWHEVAPTETSPTVSDREQTSLASPLAAPSPRTPVSGGAGKPEAPGTRPLANAGARSGSLAEETRLVGGADEALRGGDPTRALALLDEHAKNFKDGILAEERAAERVTALCKLGRVGDARDEADRFLRTIPDSPLAVNVRASCGGR
jgi:hypothetical protein